MAAERIIPLDPESNVKDLFDQVGDRPAIVSIGGKRFQVTPEVEDIWANYDPERALAGMRAAIGLFVDKGVDFDKWREEIKEQRGQYSVGRPYDE
jgi:hypothetical protein